ncbi:MAG TPA: polysaccharide deacetylase family protein [Pyrinomonadaceae bacterium]
MWLVAALLGVLLVAVSSGVAQRASSSSALPPVRREVAITIDDLPMADGVNDLVEIETTTEKLPAPLVKHRVPAIGFVNEGNLYVKGEMDARIDILRMWLDVGMTLGNHTFSHASFSRTPVQHRRGADARAPSRRFSMAGWSSECWTLYTRRSSAA